MTAKLHELLAVETDLEGAFQKIIRETIGTFEKRVTHFMGFVRTLELFQKEEGAPETPVERKAMDTTVADKLDYQMGHIVRYIDAVYQKEATNQSAKADIILDSDNVLAKDVPVTALLGLERFLGRIRETYNAIPTLPPGIEWEIAAEEGPNIYRRKHPKREYKTEKRIVPQILYKHTKEHPAQVKELPEVFNVGIYIRQETCSLLTPAQKSEMLARIDQLLRAVKKARQRANREEVKSVKIGQALFNYIHQV